MADPVKPLNRLKPFRRINNDSFRPSSAPDGKGVACGCHVPDEFPNIENDFKEYLKKNSATLGTFLEALDKAKEVAKEIATVTKTAILIADAAIAAGAGSIGGPIGAVLAALATTGKVVAEVSKFIDNMMDLVNDAIHEFFARIGTKLAKRAIRRLPQWVPVKQGASSARITQDQLVEVEGIVTRSFGDPIGVPFFQWHRWLNWSFQVKPEADYGNLVVQGFEFNKDGRQSGETPLIASDTFEVQWDAGALLVSRLGEDENPYEKGFPKETNDLVMPDFDGPMVNCRARGSNWIWPTAGMYAWASGRWVYDCARTDSTTDKDPKMIAMMNPPRAMATATWEAHEFVENTRTGSGPSGEFTHRVPSIHFFFVAAKDGGYMSHQTLADGDYEFILDLPPIEGPAVPFPVGHTFAHPRDPGEPPDFPHNTIVIRPRLLRSLEPIDGSTGKTLKPVIELLPPPKPGAPPQQVKVTVRAGDLVGRSITGFNLWLGWFDPNKERAATVKNCEVKFNTLQGRLAVDRDSPLKQLKDLYQDDLNDLKDILKRKVDDLELPSPLPAGKVSINDLLKSKIPLVPELGKKLQSVIHDAIDTAFDKILEVLTGVVAETQTEEWLMRIGVNGQWATRYLQSVAHFPISFSPDVKFDIALGPDDPLFWSSSGVEFNPVGDMMRAAHADRILKDKDGQELQWDQIVKADKEARRDMMFDYALHIIKGNNRSTFALGIENDMIGIKDPGDFASPGSDPQSSDPLAVKAVDPGTTQLTPVVKFAHAAGTGQEFILVEDASKSDYKLTMTIQVEQQKPE